MVMSPRPVGPVAILWDIENCPVPGEVNAEDVAGNIRIALREHPHIGAVTMFSAYGDFNHFPKKVREGCQRTGVNLIDVPNGKKDAADKAILVDMFLFALDNPPPSTIFLVTGDVDFAPALHKLGQRGYVVVLVIPDGVGVSSALRGAGRYVWDWPSLCRGQGLVEVPARSSSQRRSPSVVHSHNLYTEERPSYPSELYENHVDDDDHVHGEEILVQRKPMGFPISHSSYPQQQHVDFGHQTYGLPGPVHTRVNANPLMATRSTTRSHINTGSPGGFGNRTPQFATPDINPAPQAMDMGFSGSEMEQQGQPVTPEGTSWVQPGDFGGLKKQLVWLLTQNGGSMTLVKLPPEYSKHFGRPLYLAEYNSLKLVHLLEKMKDTLVIRGEGTQRTVHLKSRNKYKPSGNKASSLPKTDRDASEDSDPDVKDVSEVPALDRSRHLLDMDMDDVKPNVFLASHPVDWDSVTDAVKGKLDATKTESAVDNGEVCKADDYKVDPKLTSFKEKLQELLVVYALKIELKMFMKLYQQRYGDAVDLKKLGVDSLDALFQKVKDVAVLKEKIVKGDKGESRKEYDVVAV
jgi:hypothetical protein